MSLTAGQRLGPYEIRVPLGAGGMGEVYRARDTKLDRDVALKILPESVAADPDRLMRFEREAKTLASINHPHIAQIYNVEEGSPSFLVMELVEGEDLAQRIARGPLPLDDLLPIGRQIADALEAAHEAGIIHRDLKPANIRVRPDGTVKVLDFGLAKDGRAAGAAAGAVLNSPTITSPALTAAGMILGTAAYMSPEQAKGKPVDTRTDVWAFGCVVPIYAAELVGTGRGAFSVSHDGVLVYISPPDTALQRLTWFDRQGKELGTWGAPALYFGPRIAPDGRRVAVASFASSRVTR